MKTTRLSLTTTMILAACATGRDTAQDSTVVPPMSTQGKAPDAELAHKHGMRYVHDFVEVPHDQ